MHKGSKTHYTYVRTTTLHDSHTAVHGSRAHYSENVPENGDRSCILHCGTEGKGRLGAELM